jgi:hypothetical protein
MEDKKVMKNMEYWKKKNNIPGIEALENAGLTDGRAGSSAFQMQQSGDSPLQKGFWGKLGNIASGGLLGMAGMALGKNNKSRAEIEGHGVGSASGVGSTVPGGAGGGIEEIVAEKVDEKVDEKVEAAVSGGAGSAMMMKSPIYAGVETKKARGEMMDLVEGEKQESSAQDLANIKNDHDVDDDGVPQTDPEGYWKKAAKHGIYPKGKSPSKIYSKEGAPDKY